MTSREFTIWMKGFAQAANDFTLTPKQWDDLKDQLNKVEDSSEDLEDLENDFFGAWEENHQRMDAIGQNGNEGLHYEETPVGVGGFGVPNTGVITGSVTISSVWTGTPAHGTTYTVTSGSSYGGGATYTYPNGTTVSYTVGGTNDHLTTTNKDLLHD